MRSQQMGEVQKSNTTKQDSFSIISNIPEGASREQVCSLISSHTQLISFSIVRIRSENIQSIMRVGIAFVVGIQSVFQLTSRKFLIGKNEAIKFNMVPEKSNLVQIVMTRQIVLSLRYSSGDKSMFRNVIDFIEEMCPNAIMTSMKGISQTSETEILFKVPPTFVFKENNTKSVILISNCQVHFSYFEEEFLEDSFVQEKPFLRILAFESVKPLNNQELPNSELKPSKEQKGSGSHSTEDNNHNLDSRHSKVKIRGETHRPGDKNPQLSTQMQASYTRSEEQEPEGKVTKEGQVLGDSRWRPPVPHQEHMTNIPARSSKEPSSHFSNLQTLCGDRVPYRIEGQPPCQRFLSEAIDNEINQEEEGVYNDASEIQNEDYMIRNMLDAIVEDSFQDFSDNDLLSVNEVRNNDQVLRTCSINDPVQQECTKYPMILDCKDFNSSTNRPLTKLKVNSSKFEPFFEMDEPSETTEVLPGNPFQGLPGLPDRDSFESWHGADQGKQILEMISPQTHDIEYLSKLHTPKIREVWTRFLEIKEKIKIEKETKDAELKQKEKSKPESQTNEEPQAKKKLNNNQTKKNPPKKVSGKESKAQKESSTAKAKRDVNQRRVEGSTNIYVKKY